jgi:hypothetical protein
VSQMCQHFEIVLGLEAAGHRGGVAEIGEKESEMPASCRSRRGKFFRRVCHGGSSAPYRAF